LKHGWIALLLLVGCATVTPAFHPTQSVQALVNWRHGADSLTADVAFQKGAGGALRLIVSKGMSLLVLTRTGDEWTATGPLARGGWHGKVEHAPAPLAGWICFAAACDGRTAGFEITCAAGDRFRAIFSAAAWRPGARRERFP
jgi:hypothetical protein